MKPLREGEQKILMHMLEKNKPTVLSALVSEVGGSPNALVKNINRLVILGLLKEKREEKFPFRRHLELTEKGRKVAQLLKQIYDTIGL